MRAFVISFFTSNVARTTLVLSRKFIAVRIPRAYHTVTYYIGSPGREQSCIITTRLDDGTRLLHFVRGETLSNS